MNILINYADKNYKQAQCLNSWSKPTERLILSCSATSPDGQAKSPSAAFSRVKYLFPHLKVEYFSSSLLPAHEATRHRTPVEDAVSRPTARRLLGDEMWQFVACIVADLQVQWLYDATT